jgi:hypothetical protein
MRGHDPKPPHATERGNAARCRPSRDGSDDEASDDNPPHGARPRVSVRAHGAGARRRISSRSTVNPTGGSGVLISFRAPSEEGEDCCSSFKYLMVVGAAADCLRGSFLGPPLDETLVGVDDDQDRDRDRRQSGPRVRSRGGSRQRTGGGPACVASRAMSGARTPAQAAVAPLWLATDAAADAPVRRVGPVRRGDRVALSIRQVIRA